MLDGRKRKEVGKDRRPTVTAEDREGDGNRVGRARALLRRGPSGVQVTALTGGRGRRARCRTTGGPSPAAIPERKAKRWRALRSCRRSRISRRRGRDFWPAKGPTTQERTTTGGWQ